jgi:flagellar hook-length control protein FliK
VLSISNDQTSVAFSSNQLEVRQALENALPRLREMMSESGIALGNATVDAGTPDGRDGQQQAGRGDGASGRGGSGTGQADTGAIAAPRTRPLGDGGMVDTFA